MDNVPAVKQESSFALIRQEAQMLSKSEIVPNIYQGGGDKAIANCIIAIGVAKEVNASVLMVMQNLHIIQGKPTWASSFVISAINSCGRFGSLKFKKAGTGMDATCMAYANEKATGELLEGPTISMQMAKEEGWLGKSGSKWKTMPELMLMYRSAAFFGRLYAPEMLNGMHTVEEVPDMDIVEPVNLEESVVEITDEPVEVTPEMNRLADEITEAVTEDVPPVSDLIDPPTEDGDVTDKQINAILKLVTAGGIKSNDGDNNYDIRTEVSQILGFNDTIGNLHFLDKSHASILIPLLGEMLDKKMGKK